ncbi:MAG TPA: serine/threonine-protein kinase, partial [Polyangiales bacterium]|nr:serine/threonine-protein kinase [Polyangiales bacterium]
MRHIAGYTITEALISTPEYLVLRARLGDRPVLLRLPANEYPTLDAIARLRHGYELQRSLDTPGVTKTIALEEHDRSVLLVMADEGGEPLRSSLRGEALNLQDALRIALQLVQTLGNLHQRGVVHQRVNPANVFVDSSTWDVKLAHFEYSSVLNSDGPTAVGSTSLEEELPYISPEQTGRMNRGVDHRTDFYSLGAMLYEMLTGRVPFVEADPMALVHCHIAIAPESPRKLSPSVPEAISSIVMKLLAKNAEDRYQSAYGVAADLSNCLRQLVESGEVGSIVTGESDAPATFQLPHRLYGREAEKAQLLSAFERAAAGSTEVCLVAGRSGTGKSSLVSEIQK